LSLNSNAVKGAINEALKCQKGGKEKSYVL